MKEGGLKHHSGFRCEHTGVSRVPPNELNPGRRRLCGGCSTHAARMGAACGSSERCPAGSRSVGTPPITGLQNGKGRGWGVRWDPQRTPGRPGTALGGRDHALGGAWSGTGGPDSCSGAGRSCQGWEEPEGGPRRLLPECSSCFLIPVRPHPHLELSPSARDGGGHMIRANMATAAAGS